MSQLHTPSEVVATYPIEDAGVQFPPVCLKTHWDPTEMIKRILPQQRVSLPEPFRPYVRVCKKYVTSAPMQSAPLPPSSVAFPVSGGGSSTSMPPGRYAAAIDKESVLRTLDHPLDRWCPGSQYVPSLSSDLFRAGSTLPERKAVSSAFVSELAMPQALLRTGAPSCRAENDTAYFLRSGRLFNNPTKQDRYGADKYYANEEAVAFGHGRGDPMPHGGVNRVQPTDQARRAVQNVFDQPGGKAEAAYGKAEAAYGKAEAASSSTIPKAQPQVVGVSAAGSAARVW